jgi:hypothetical protein
MHFQFLFEFLLKIWYYDVLSIIYHMYLNIVQVHANLFEYYHIFVSIPNIFVHLQMMHLHLIPAVLQFPMMPLLFQNIYLLYFDQ